ncbi:SppA protein [Leptolyngbya sp. FACHB-36]|uniref:SDH family Clp fold serine proteinase n=1 Tax=Leptolyngbya sp. FACHB-36 TaxID=2692808 RepID=UPI00168131FA|nr:SppA protein [Leptolyngbya sp. FACHB-36]MBD2018780.1 SppA protein [Leptolyngbya sp. FACHB-36]
MSETLAKAIANAVNPLAESLEADIFLYSAQIAREYADCLIQEARRIDNPRKNAGLILTTHGGDADAAFQIMRFLQRRYDQITLFVFGHCKSAGTLMALGADEIVMSDFGEFGPLDVQVSKRDELFWRESGLDIQQALDVLGAQAFTYFESYFLDLISSTQGGLSTKTAADIASSMAVQLLTPVSTQIDPLRIGEMNRVMQIAQDYGKRLSDTRSRPLTQKALQAITQLSSGYHSHSFVIDFEEATQLFENVREPTEAELAVERLLLGLVRSPLDPGIIKWIEPVSVDSQEVGGQDEQNTDEGASERASEGAVPGDNGQSTRHAEPYELSTGNSKLFSSN